MPTLLEFFQSQKSSKINHSSRDIVSFRRVWCSYVYKWVIRIIISWWETVKHHCVHWQPKYIRCWTHFKTNPGKAISSWYISDKRNSWKKWNQHYMEKTKQICHVLTKSGASPNVIPVVLSSLKMTEFNFFFFFFFWGGDCYIY